MTETQLSPAAGQSVLVRQPRKVSIAQNCSNGPAAQIPSSTESPSGGVFGLHVASVLVGRLGTRIEINADDKKAHWATLERLTLGHEPGATVASAAAEPFLERRFELTALKRDADGALPVYCLTGRERHGLDLWGARTRFVGRQGLANHGGQRF